MASEGKDPTATAGTSVGLVFVEWPAVQDLLESQHSVVGWGVREVQSVKGAKGQFVLRRVLREKLFDLRIQEAGLSAPLRVEFLRVAVEFLVAPLPGFYRW